MDEITLKKLQRCETDILSRVDSFCAAHHIKYSMYAGTALGAVRHGGFIPWDDDIDICMERNEYERFIAEWNSENGINDLWLQDPEHETSRINHAKIRKNGTVFSSFADAEEGGHQGIWIDIFPLDKVPTNKLKRKELLFIAKIRLVYTRGYTIKSKGVLLRLVSRVMLLIPRKLQIRIRKKCDQFIKRYRDMKNDYCLMSLTAAEDLKLAFPAGILDHVKRVPFEDCQLQLTDQYDEMLRLNFGDYMQLPPESERICKHNPDVLLFEDDEQGEK